MFLKKKVEVPRPTRLNNETRALNDGIMQRTIPAGGTANPTLLLAIHRKSLATAHQLQYQHPKSTPHLYGLLAHQWPSCRSAASIGTYCAISLPTCALMFGRMVLELSELPCQNLGLYIFGCTASGKLQRKQYQTLLQHGLF